MTESRKKNNLPISGDELDLDKNWEGQINFFSKIFMPFGLCWAYSKLQRQYKKPAHFQNGYIPAFRRQSTIGRPHKVERLLRHEV